MSENTAAVLTARGVRKTFGAVDVIHGVKEKIAQRMAQMPQGSSVKRAAAAPAGAMGA